MPFKNIKSISDFYISFAGPKSTSPLVAFPILAFLSLGALFTETIVNDARRRDLIEIGIFAFTLSFLYFASIGYLINRFTQESSLTRSLFLVFLYFTTEIIRTLFIGREILEKRFADEVQWDYRILAGGLTGVLFFGVFSVVFNDSTRYKANLRHLRAIQEELKNTTAVTQEDLDKNKNRIIDSIRDAVNQALRTLLEEKNENKENTKLIVNELVRVSEEVVRPLSHELFSEKIEQPTDLDKPQERIFSAFKVFKLATYVNPFHPVLTSLFGLFQFLGLALFLTENTLNAFLTMLAFVFWIFMVLYLAQKFIKPKLFKMSLIPRILVINLIYWIMSSFLFLDTRLADNLMLPHTIELYFYLITIGTIIPWLFAVYSAIKFAQLETLESVQQTNERLNWSNARLGARLWADQKKLATIVHRDIQGALIAKALKFKLDIESGINPDIAVEQVRELISSTTDLLSNKEVINEPKTEVANLNNLWDGIFKISMRVSDDLYFKILADSICSQTINDFIIEFATNSVKHGKATHGEITIEQFEEMKIKITMINDGLLLPAKIKHGLGSIMVLQQSLSVVHENLSDGRVYFAATIPISK